MWGHLEPQTGVSCFSFCLKNCTKNNSGGGKKPGKWHVTECGPQSGTNGGSKLRDEYRGKTASGAHRRKYISGTVSTSSKCCINADPSRAQNGPRALAILFVSHISGGSRVPGLWFSIKNWWNPKVPYFQGGGSSITILKISKSPILRGFTGFQFWVQNSWNAWVSYFQGWR